MKKLLLFLLLISSQTHAQEKLWTEADRRYTIENFVRTRDELVRETENLTPDQWAFKESPDRWSIGEVVEHLALWEIIWAREIGMGSQGKPQPELNKTSRPDSYYKTLIVEDAPHVSPFISRPTGFIKGKDNLSFFVNRHALNISFIEKTEADMRSLFELTGTPNPRNMHQVYLYQWGHIDRHLKQIRKVKMHKDYPH